MVRHGHKSPEFTDKAGFNDLDWLACLSFKLQDPFYSLVFGCLVVMPKVEAIKT